MNIPNPMRTSRGICGAEKTGNKNKITLHRIKTKMNVSNLAVVM